MLSSTPPSSPPYPRQQVIPSACSVPLSSLLLQQVTRSVARYPFTNAFPIFFFQMIIGILQPRRLETLVSTSSPKAWTVSSGDSQILLKSNLGNAGKENTTFLHLCSLFKQAWLQICPVSMKLFWDYLYEVLF